MELNDKKPADGKMSLEQVELMLKLMFLNKASRLKAIKDIEDSTTLSPEEKFDKLAAILNPAGGPSEGTKE